MLPLQGFQLPGNKTGKMFQYCSVSVLNGSYILQSGASLLHNTPRVMGKSIVILNFLITKIIIDIVLPQNCAPLNT